MITFLASKFIPNYTNYYDNQVRTKYGQLTGLLGIFLNIFLFIIKLLAGIFSSSIAIIADAFNNLSDAGSSIITFFGFKLSGLKPDADHPYGHGRFEYISGLVVALLILLMSYELIQSSFLKIIHPQKSNYSPIIFLILIISILVKIYMFLYNSNIGNKISSPTLKANSLDSLSDIMATTVILITSFICMITPCNLEGYAGLIVAIFVGYNGYCAAKETISPLLGTAPDSDFIDDINRIVATESTILSTHDLMVHNYGPGQIMITLHAEVSSEGNVLDLHEALDNIERKIHDELHCNAVLHMDPICVNDPTTLHLKKLITAKLLEISPLLSLHDFRVTSNSEVSNISFDIVTPFDFNMADTLLLQVICDYIHTIDEKYIPNICIDKN